MVDTHGCGEGYQKNELHGREILGQKNANFGGNRKCGGVNEERQSVCDCKQMKIYAAFNNIG